MGLSTPLRAPSPIPPSGPPIRQEDFMTQRVLSATLHMAGAARLRIPAPARFSLRCLSTLALLATAIAAPVRAQVSPETSSGRATITGVVKDATSGAPVLGVTVSIPGTTFQTT